MTKEVAEVTVGVPFGEAFRVAHDVLLSMNAKISSSVPAGGLLIADTGMNWRTWGDRIVVEVSAVGAQASRVQVSSESPSQVIAWGKNKDNVNTFVQRLQQRVSLAQPAAQPAATPAPVTRKVFVSYRRSDTIDVSGRIYDRMVQEFGHANVFKDVDNIPFGIDFVTYLDTAVKNCDVLLAIIGPQWLTAVDELNKRRLEDPGDFVRIEIESALRRDILVVPLLVGGAGMPRADQLPATLQPLVRRNGTAIRPDPDFHSDITRLIAHLG